MSDKTTIFDVAKYFDEVVKKNIEKNSSTFIDKCFASHSFDRKALSASNEEISRLNKTIEKKSKKGWKSPWVTFAVVLLFICGIIPGIILLVYMIKNRKKIDQEVSQLTNQRDHLVSQCTETLAPICSEITTRKSFDLMEESYPTLKLSETISHGDFNNFKPYIEVERDNISTYSNLHGSVQNHPFFLLTQKRVDMVPKVYTGFTTVMVSSYDSEGHHRTESRTVTATITKPFPEFTFPTKLIFRSTLLHDLEFVNEPPLKNEHALKHFYKKYNNIRPMENKEFDMMYPFVRNNEIKFRSLFTIFAQEEMVRNTKQFGLKNMLFFKDTGPYFEVELGSDLNGVRLNYSGYTYLHYDPELIKKNFTMTINQSLTALYQFLSPLLSCSLLQHERYLQPTKKSRNTNSTMAQLENYFNTNLDISKFLNEHTSHLAYNGITKFNPIKSNSKFEVNRLTTNSYSSKPRVEYVHKFAYGQSVSVPVHYDEFYPEYATFLTLSWKAKKDRDYICYNIPKQLQHFKIKTISQDTKQVLVTFDPTVKSIDGQEEAIISAVNQYFK